MRQVVFNRKGGVGKSTIVVNLAAVAADRGRRTLVVDLDPQGNSTQYLLGRDMEKARPTVGDFFTETLGFRLLGPSVERYIHPTPFENLFLMASDPALMDLHGKLESRHKIYKLKEQLEELDDFDAVYLDTPPALNFFTTSALIAAESCLIPFDCDDFSRRAIYQLMGSAREIREDHNPDLEIAGIVVNFFQARARLPQRQVEELRAEGLPVLEPYLTTSVKVKESHEANQPLIHLAPSHKLSDQFRALWENLESARSPNIRAVS